MTTAIELTAAEIMAAALKVREVRAENMAYLIMDRLNAFIPESCQGDARRALREVFAQYGVDFITDEDRATTKRLEDWRLKHE